MQISLFSLVFCCRDQKDPSAAQRSSTAQSVPHWRSSVRAAGECRNLIGVDRCGGTEGVLARRLGELWPSEGLMCGVTGTDGVPAGDSLTMLCMAAWKPVVRLTAGCLPRGLECLVTSLTSDIACRLVASSRRRWRRRMGDPLLMGDFARRSF